jgi:hypothetical protein
VPTRRGFGISLIERSLAGIGGSARLHFESTGLRCSIRVPLAEDAAAPASPADGDGRKLSFPALLPLDDSNRLDNA